MAIVDHIPAAAGLAGMLADVGAGGGQGVVLADQAHGVGVAPDAHQGHVARDIHARRTQGHAGHRDSAGLPGTGGAGRAPHSRPGSPPGHPRTSRAASRPMAQSAVSTMAAGGLLDDVDGVHVGGAVQHLWTCSLVSWPRPMRQGTHLPQVWAWHSCRNDRDISTGHRPGGLAAIRRSTSR